MSLSMENEINANYIAGFAPIAARSKIWLLKGFLDDHLVLKYEQTVTAESLKPTSKILKAIDPMAQMKILTPSEVGEVRKALATSFNLGLDENGNDFRPQMAEFLKIIDGKQYSFTKMRRQIVMDLNAAIQQQIAGNGDAIGQFTTTLVEKGGLEGIGGVLAGDLFIGNQDRFWFGVGKMTHQVGGHKFTLNCIYNVGNIMLIVKQGKYSPSMLDYMDPGNFYVAQDVDTLENRSGKLWTGRYLFTKDLRGQMAEQVVDDLEQLLCPIGTQGKPKLGKNRKARIVAGMEDGVRKIIKQLDPKGGVGKLPKGLQSRYDVLTARMK